MKKTTFKIYTLLAFALCAFQSQGQTCSEIYLEPGIYKISTCGLDPELYMTINNDGDLEWAELAPEALQATQLWTITDHRGLDPNGYVEITADLSSLNSGPFTMIVDESTYEPTTDTDVRISVRPGLPVVDTDDPNWGFDQYQRRRESGWSGPGNNALFAKPPGQGNLRYRVAPSQAGDPVIFHSGGSIGALRMVLVEPLGNEDFDFSSVFISNPVKDELTIDGLNQTIKQISVYDLLGKQLITSEPEGNMTSTKIDLSALNTGLYIVKLDGENGASFSKKIIKE